MAEELTTGWEPDLPADDSLLRAFVLATADRGETIGLAAGGRAERTDEAVFVDAESPIVFENVVALLQPPTAERARAIVAEALEWFRPSGRSS